MSLSRGGTILLCVLLLLGVVLIGGAGAASEVIDSEHEFGFEADDTVLIIDLGDGGDASFSVEYRIALDNEADRDAFDELSTEIATNESTYLDRFSERFEPTVTDAAALTGRDMALLNLTVSTETRPTVDQQYGVVNFSFTWTAFAVVDGSEITAGDALEGLFLTDNTHLVVEWPQEYGLDSAAPDPDETSQRSLTWSGPREFAGDEPRVVVNTDVDAPPIADEDGPFTPAVIVAVLLVVVLLGGGGWYYRRTSAEPEPTPETSAPAEPSDELLSNEERVVALVSEHGGRMKQKEVATELDWTAAKTSKVVGTLREEGELEAFRLGRENVLRLPEEDDEL